MTRRGTQATRASFVVRVVRDQRGRLSGVIERVATGAKEVFQDVEAIGAVIERMVEREPTVVKLSRAQGRSTRRMP